jgi:hypothetical protein
MQAEKYAQSPGRLTRHSRNCNITIRPKPELSGWCGRATATGPADPTAHAGVGGRCAPHKAGRTMRDRRPPRAPGSPNQPGESGAGGAILTRLACVRYPIPQAGEGKRGESPGVLMIASLSAPLGRRGPGRGGERSNAEESSFKINHVPLLGRSNPTSPCLSAPMGQRGERIEIEINRPGLLPLLHK